MDGVRVVTRRSVSEFLEAVATAGLIVAFSPLWLVAVFAYLTIAFARWGWDLADDTFGML